MSPPRVAVATCAQARGLDEDEPVLRWNTDKSYLRDLAATGVPVVRAPC